MEMLGTNLENVMKTIHLESQRVGRKIEIEMRRGKSIFEALAVATMEAHDRQERQKKAITGMWIDEADKVPNVAMSGEPKASLLDGAVMQQED
jgi:hypothetical protein